MNSAPFQVMDASAGSGKTRNLIKSVLIQALKHRQPEYALKPVMAITFTNKAAAEMKSRLLDYLIIFSSNAENESELLEEIAAAIGCEQVEIIKRSRNLLKYILHHYNDLSFGTIDSFTSRLVRTFAKDLALSENFEIILDTQQLLAEATDQVISEAGKNDKLTQMLVAFVEQKLEDEKNWRIDNALMDVAKKLLQEKHREPLSRLRDFTPEDFERIRVNLKKKQKTLTTEIENFGQTGLTLISNNGVPHASFAGGANGFPNFFNYLADARLDKCLTFTNTVQKNIDADKWHAAKATTSEKAAIDEIKEQLLELALNGKTFAREHGSFILLSQKIIQNTYALATLSALDNALTDIEEAQNILPLAAFNHIVNEKVKGEPAPFIFERLGERYKHFFIDEFQDTSKLQWENLLPLIENATAEKGSALLVGDAKQSIYRWRNGEAEQFIDLSKRADSTHINTAIKGELIRLEDNWRSKKTIVEFNNELFKSAAEHLENEGYQSLYKNAFQNPKKDEGGFVGLKFIDGNDFINDAIDYSIQQIEELLKAGYAHKDIALLVRSNKDGENLVNALTSNGFPVISGDSLFLGNSYEGKLLSGALALRTAAKNRNYRWAFAEGLLKMNLINPPKGNFAFAFELVNAEDDVSSIISGYFPGFQSIYNAPTDLYTYARQVCDLLNLDFDDNAFVQSFLQAVLTFVERESGNSFDFIRWWEEKGSNISISPPDEIDALKVVTIHKSKGLQYPIVIIPFTKWGFYENSREAWINLDPNTFEGLTEILLSVSSSGADVIGGEYAEKYKTLEDQEKFDSLNMLYVACTRAEEQLFVVGKSKPGKQDIMSVVKAFAENHDNKKIDESYYCWGDQITLTRKKVKDELKGSQKVLREGWQEKVKLAITAPVGWEENKKDARAWGNLVHYTMARIKTSNDVESVLSSLQNRGALERGDFDELKATISQIIEHPKLKNLFISGVTVYNERDIILVNEERKRPDRITQLADGTIVLIDYKTGEHKKEHKVQLKEYSDLLNSAGMPVKRKYLLYLDNGLELEEV